MIGRFQQNFGRDRQGRRSRDQVAVVGALSGRTEHDAGSRAARFRIDRPARGRGADQHRFRGRAGLAHDRRHLFDALTAAGRHRVAAGWVPARFSRRERVAHAIERHFEFFGNEHRQRRRDALTHLSLIDHDRDDAVAIEAHPTERRPIARCGTGDALRYLDPRVQPAPATATMRRKSVRASMFVTSPRRFSAAVRRSFRGHRRCRRLSACVASSATSLDGCQRLLLAECVRGIADAVEVVLPHHQVDTARFDDRIFHL